MKQTRNSFSDDEIKAFAPSEKIAIVATVSDDNSPHLTLLTSLMAAAPDRVVIGRDIAEQGNTSAASIPLALERLLETGEARSGQLALLIGFGAGLVYGAQVVRIP